MFNRIPAGSHVHLLPHTPRATSPSPAPAGNGVHLLISSISLLAPLRSAHAPLVRRATPTSLASRIPITYHEAWNVDVRDAEVIERGRQRWLARSVRIWAALHVESGLPDGCGGHFRLVRMEGRGSSGVVLRLCRRQQKRVDKRSPRERTFYRPRNRGIEG